MEGAGRRHSTGLALDRDPGRRGGPEDDGGLADRGGGPGTMEALRQFFRTGRRRRGHAVRATGEELKFSLALVVLQAHADIGKVALTLIDAGLGLAGADARLVQHGPEPVDVDRHRAPMPDAGVLRDLPGARPEHQDTPEGHPEKPGARGSAMGCMLHGIPSMQ